MAEAIVVVDTHKMRTEEAYRAVLNAVEKAGTFTYRVRVIHGFNGGTRIRSMIREEFSYGRCDRVKRIVMGENEGITELILREY